eukprot:m.202598 g.202598  ORF g.202598 m.202598 type:complete len:62 (-) comp14977_c1_seq14:1327-1512(-)
MKKVCWTVRLIQTLRQTVSHHSTSPPHLCATYACFNVVKELLRRHVLEDETYSAMSCACVT